MIISFLSGTLSILSLVYFLSIGILLLLLYVVRELISDRTISWLGDEDFPTFLVENAVAYSPLKPGHIRLLHLQPGVRGSPLKANLFPAQLSTHLHYEALSYVWGPRSLSRKIILDGKLFTVTRNLHAALSDLRLKDDIRVLWVDAICVDQDNFKERSNQVLLMGDVYRLARRVVVYLDSRSPWCSRQVIKGVHCRNPSKPPPRRNLVSIHVVSTLLSSSWWTRVWTIQELVLARTVIIQAGTISVDWGIFCDLVFEASKEELFRSGRHHYAKFSSILKHRLRHQEGGALRFDLLSLAYDLRGREATDPRDQLFALLGMLAPETEANRSKTIRPFPNCGEEEENTAEAVSRRFTRRCVNNFRSLGALAVAEHSHNLEATLTTRAAWSSFSSEAPSQLFWTGGIADSKVLDDLGPVTCHAAGGVLAISCNAEDDKLPRVRGAIQDSVIAIGTAAGLTSYVSAESQLQPDHENSNNPLAEHIATVMHHFFRTIHYTVSGIVRWEVVLPVWEQITTHFTSHELAEQRFHRAITAGIFSSRPAHGSDDEAKYEEARDKICRGRCLFVTKSGFVGIGPAQTRVDDLVCILLSADVPMILRPFKADSDFSEETKAYIGQAYVDELMVYPGNIQDDILSGKLLVEDMLLR